MKIGLTGGTGFIGQCLLEMYAEQHQFKVICIENDTEAFFKHKNIEYRTSNCSVEEMKALFDGCDAIANMGGVLSTKEREESLENYKPNMILAENVFVTARDIGVSNVVNISSRTVYNHNLNGPYRETDKLKPLNNYALAKRKTEELADEYNCKYGMKIKTLRFAQVFGPNGRNGYMMEVFRKNAAEGKMLTVMDANGKELLYVKDAAKAVICACNNAEESGVFNIGSGVFLTNKEIAECFCNVYENKAGIKYEGEAGKQGIRQYMDISKARKCLGFETEYRLEDAIREIKEVTAE